MSSGSVLLGAILALMVVVPIAVIWARRSLAQTQRALRRAQHAERLAELGSMTGGLAHEIKNPLSTLKINLQLLREDLKDLPDQDTAVLGRMQRKLETLRGEADRLGTILEDFLRFAGKHELNLQPIDFNVLVSDVLEFFAPQARSAGITLRSEMAPEPLRLKVDVDLIKQALLNLLINAQQAMSGAGPDSAAELIVKTSRDQDQVAIEVIDTGPGIKSDEQNKIFQAYYSTKPSGTGLGLPTTRHIISEHQGTLHLDSERGKGTRFVIRLPLQRS